MSRALSLVLVLGFAAATALAADPKPTQQSAPRATVARTPSTLKIMNQRLPEVRFVDQPLDQVIDWLADFTHMNVVVRWQILQDSGLKRDKPITIQARNLRLTQVLWLIMNEAGGSELVLAYRASGNMLVLSTAEDLGKEVITKVYDVADLLIYAPKTGLPNYQQSQGLQAGGQGGGSSNIFGQQQSQQQQQQQLGTGGRPVQLDTLIKIIQDTVEPDSWKTNGGQVGSIEVFGNLLIVRNTILAHQQLGGYVSEAEISGQ